jgi:hypothetical protein
VGEEVGARAGEEEAAVETAGVEAEMVAARALGAAAGARARAACAAAEPGVKGMAVAMEAAVLEVEGLAEATVVSRVVEAKRAAARVQLPPLRRQPRGLDAVRRGTQLPRLQV